MKSLLVAVPWMVGSGLACAQAGGPALGSVATVDATVVAPAAASMPASQGRVAVAGGSVITANPGRNADVALTRGGSVLVCQTSGLHIAGTIPGPLLLALDRGAMEIRMNSQGDDSVMTPDLRFTMAGGGTLDLRVRVSFNGDTCVENRGRKAPTLRLTDAFGDTSYEVKPGQHVLFEHGSLREVVDRETTPCGCPPAQAATVSIAEAALYGGQGKTSGGQGKTLGGQSKVSAQEAEAAHPFPAAVSEGLAPPATIPAEQPTGGTHVQVATALTYDPNAPVSAVAESSSTPIQAPVPARPHRSALGSFFHGIKRIFTGGSD